MPGRSIAFQKQSRRLLLSSLAILSLAVLAALWAVGWFTSLLSYRSPLSAHPPSAGLPVGKPLTHRVVFVLVDALRYDTASRHDVMPFLNELRPRGAWARMRSRPPSYSQPGYTVLLTGAWPELSDGPVINLDAGQIPVFTQDDLFSAARRAGLKTAVSGFFWFEKLLPPQAVNASYYTTGEDRLADQAVVDAALSWLDGNQYQLILIHLDQVDYSGHHEGGPRNPRWDAAAGRADELLRTIAGRLDFSQDTLFVTSDHGQILAGGHGGHEAEVLLEPFLLVGPGVIPGDYDEIAMVDVAPTLTVLLGANLPASSQGRPRTEMLALRTAQQAGVEQALAQQQEALLAAYQAAVGLQIQPLSGIQDPLLASQFSLESARIARLNSERLPRLLVAVLVALLPVLLLYRRWRAGGLSLRVLEIAWGGAALYLLLFHARFAWLDRRNYSFSTVSSPADILLYLPLTSGAALAISWLVAAFAGGDLRRGPGASAGAVLRLTAATQYLLLLPALWSFVLNGARVSWSLPDFASGTLALFTLIQIPLVAIFGFVLAGLAALVARSIQNR